MNQKRSLMKKRKVITDDDDDSIDLNLDLPAQQNGVGSSFNPQTRGREAGENRVENRN